MRVPTCASWRWVFEMVSLVQGGPSCVAAGRRALLAAAARDEAICSTGTVSRLDDDVPASIVGEHFADVRNARLAGCVDLQSLQERGSGPVVGVDSRSRIRNAVRLRRAVITRNGHLRRSACCSSQARSGAVFHKGRISSSRIYQGAKKNCLAAIAAGHAAARDGDRPTTAN